MSTRSQIAVYEPECRKYTSVYCHSDGYPQGVGALLLEAWNNLDSALHLTKCSMSYPGKPHVGEGAMRPKAAVGDKAFHELMEAGWADWAYRWNRARAQWEVSKDGTVWTQLAAYLAENPD